MGEENLRESFSNLWAEDFDPLLRTEPLCGTNAAVSSYGEENIYEGLNERLKQQIEQTQRTLLLCTSDYYKWSPLYIKDGIEASRRLGNGIACVRGQTLMPYSIHEIFEILSDVRYRKIIEPTVETCCPIKPLSSHSGIEYLKFKGIWPTAPRDFCNFLHWKLLQNGIFLYFAFDEPSPLFPERSNVVRGHLHLGGYVMKQVHGGTMISLVVQVRLDERMTHLSHLLTYGSWCVY
jgi:hypothetical protein